MLNLEEIDRTILELENHDTTYATCEKLAWLYVVRDHINNNQIKSYNLRGSEFLNLCSGVEIPKLLDVINEYMDVVKVLHPKEYDSVTNRIKTLK